MVLPCAFDRSNLICTKQIILKNLCFKLYGTHKKLYMTHVTKGASKKCSDQSIMPIDKWLGFATDYTVCKKKNHIYRDHLKTCTKCMQV